MREEIEKMKVILSDLTKADEEIKRHLGNQGRYTVVELMKLVETLNSSVKALISLVVAAVPEDNSNDDDAPEPSGDDLGTETA